MNRLELHMGERGLDERAWRGAVVDESLQRCHRRFYLLRRRRNELSITGARTADPVLAAAKLAGLLFGAASTGKQLSMDFAQQAVG